MYKKVPIVIFFLCACLLHYGQEPERDQVVLAGVFKGETLFVQNPFNKESMQFCVDEVLINGQRLNIDYKLSALKIDFDGFDLNTPVKIQVMHRDTLCKPLIINPEAVLFHTIYRFSSISLSDTALVWYSKGERGKGEFEIERLYNGIWVDQEVIPATGKYEGQEYVHYPSLEEGANKYRVRYNFPPGNRISHLYSMEVELEFYPDPVAFKPKSAKTHLFLSRSTHYEIYDDGNTLVLEGQGNKIDVRVLRRGRYVIYFDGRDPGTFIKE